MREKARGWALFVLFAVGMVAGAVVVFVLLATM